MTFTKQILVDGRRAAKLSPTHRIEVGENWSITHERVITSRKFGTIRDFYMLRFDANVRQHCELDGTINARDVARINEYARALEENATGPLCLSCQLNGCLIPQHLIITAWANER